MKINLEPFLKFDAHRKQGRQEKDRAALKFNRSLILQVTGVLLTVEKQNYVIALWGNVG